MTPGRHKILVRLREGPLRTDQFEEACTPNVETLKVQICRLRKELATEGLTIECVRPTPEPVGDKRFGSRTYHLRAI